VVLVLKQCGGGGGLKPDEQAALVLKQCSGGDLKPD
jgi:hypothetical protein